MNGSIQNWLDSAAYDYLAKIGSLPLPSESEAFLSEIGNLSIVTRYPSDFQKLHRDFTLERAEIILKRTEEVFQWIKKSVGS